MNQKPTASARASDPPFERAEEPRTGGGRRFVRLFLATVAVCAVVIAIALVGLYFALRGGVIENRALDARVKTTIEGLLGPGFDVDLGRTSVELHGLGLISIASNDVAVRQAGAGGIATTIGRVRVGVRPMSILGGGLRFGSISVENSTLDVSRLTETATAGAVDIDGLLRLAGAGLADLKMRLEDGHFRSIRIAGSTIIGVRLGPRSSNRVEVGEFALARSLSGDIEISARAATDFSALDVEANYRAIEGGGAELEAVVRGVDVREWIQGPEIEGGFFSSDAVVDIDANVAFGPDHTPQRPVFAVRADDANIRFGWRTVTPLRSAELNFRIIPAFNQIVLERSRLSIGRFETILAGAIQPADEADGLAGDLRYSFVAERAVGAPSVTGERAQIASMFFEGGFQRARQLLDIRNWRVVTTEGTMLGSASIGFDGETPSLVFNGGSNGISITAVKQFWPIFIGDNARRWVQANIHGGRVRQARIAASIPPGILGRLRDGRKIADDQLELEMELEGTRFDTLGELPPVSDVDAVVRVDGMRVSVELERGRAAIDGSEFAEVTAGTLTISDFMARPAPTEASIVLAADVATLARIADAEPLHVMDHLEMQASQWRGWAEADLVIKFPIKPSIDYSDVDWHVLLRLEDAGSSRKLRGRTITHADVVADISPSQVLISGNAEIDGIEGAVRVVEPVGESSSVRARSTMTTVLDEADRKKLGLDMAPVVRGPVTVTAEQSGSGPSKLSIDLERAELALPWVGWVKGPGVAASATFSMVTKGGVTSMQDLSLIGRNFHVKGNLSFDEAGVLSARLSSVALNAGDEMEVTIERADRDYTITANGASFDARGLLQKMFRQKGFVEEQGETSFRLFSSIERVQGFNRQQARNVVVQYHVKDGWLDALNLNAIIGAGQPAAVNASTTGTTTNFAIRAESAGEGMAFLDLYKRMEGGRMVANLQRDRGRPFTGRVLVEDFYVNDEPKLKTLVAAPNRAIHESNRDNPRQAEVNEIDVNRVRFLRAKADIVKGDGFLSMEDGQLAGVDIGLTYSGTLYDASDRMSLSGTFMPAFSLSRVMSAIPVFGQLLSNGQDGGFIGITYRLSGPVQSPVLEVNPLSIVAPGVFNKVFEYR